MKPKSLTLLLAGAIALAGPLAAQGPDSTLKRLSLDDWLKLKINAVVKYDQTLNEAPASVTIITAEEIQAYGYETLEDVFKFVRGFYISYDRNYSYLGARGFSRPTDYNNRILLLINGHTTNENYYGSAYIGTEMALNLDMIERLEIVRGPSSAVYGSSAIFAIINVMTKTGKMIDGLELSAGAGSYQTRRGAVQFGKQFANGADLMISGLYVDSNGQDHYYREFDNPATNNGVAKNLDTDKYGGLLANLAYKRWTLQGAFSSRRKDVPTGSFNTVFNDPAFQTTDEHAFGEIKYTGAIAANKNLLWRGYYDYYGYHGTYPYETPFFERNTGHWVGSELQWRWDPRPNNRLIFGMEYQRHLQAKYLGRTGAKLDFKLNLPYSVWSYYLQSENKVTPNLALIFSLRWDDYSEGNGASAPRVAAIYRPLPTGTLKLIYGEAFRSPSLYESRTDILATRYKSNAALLPERIEAQEAIWEQKLTAALFGTISFYNYTLRDLIDTIVDPVDSLSQQRNLSRAKATGVEVELNARHPSGLQGFASLTYQRAKDDLTNATLTNSPRHLIKAGAMAPILNFFNAAVEMQYETERRTVLETNTPAFLLANLRLTTAPLSQRVAALKNFQVGLTVNNLFGAIYQTPGGVEHLQPGITQNRRNYALRLQCKL